MKVEKSLEQGYIDKQHEAAQEIWDRDFKDSAGMQTLFSLYTVPRQTETRANTEDTIMAFFATHLEGTVLFVTTASYGPYQDATTRAVARKFPLTMSLEIVSSECADTMSTLSLLDTIARWLYTEYTAMPRAATSQVQNQLIYLPHNDIVYTMH